MSLDLYFLDRDDRRTWIEAMADLELVDDERPLSSGDLEVWSRLVDALAPVLPDAEAAAGHQSRALDDETTGISVLFATDEVSVSVPVDDLTAADPPTRELVTTIVTVMEAETGLVAFDPSANQPFLPGRRSTGRSGGGTPGVRQLFAPPKNTP